MNHKKTKNKQNYKNYTQNQKSSHSLEDELMSENYKNNSNAQE